MPLEECSYEGAEISLIIIIKNLDYKEKKEETKEYRE
jgi:hypothetical protein